MRFDKVLVGLEVQLHEDLLSRHLPGSANIIGQTLAQMADQYVRQNKTGYYPAIDFFKTLPSMDKGVFESANQLAWLASKLVRETIQKKLRPLFASVHFQSVQTLAFALPRVRPNQADCIEQLAKHYTPDTVKVELVLTLMRRDSAIKDDRVESYTRKMLFRWLRPSFATVVITNSKILQN